MSVFSTLNTFPDLYYDRISSRRMRIFTHNVKSGHEV